MAYVLPKEISASIKFTKNLYLYDFIFIAIFMCSAWGLDFLVYPPLKFFYYIFMAVMALYFRSKSSINPKKRKYQSIYYMLIRNRKSYIRA